MRRRSEVPYLCDPELEPFFAPYAWQFKNGYVVRNTTEGGRWIEMRMHHVVLGIRPGDLPPGHHVDHINHDPLDNRRDNLRVVPFEVNQRARRGDRKSTSRYKGVSWCRRSRKWIVQTSIGKRKKFLGYFASEVAAARAYDRYVKRVDPLAYTNFQEE
jgi:hypothetical protein